MKKLTLARLKLSLTLSLQEVTVWRHSICKLQTTGYQHKKSSSCTIYEDELSPSALSQSPEHPAPGQTPARIQNVHVIFYLFNNTFSNLKIFQCQRIE
jgi:hypothetical protein